MNCANCNTERFRIASRGLCKRCYAAKLGIERANKMTPLMRGLRITKLEQRLRYYRYIERGFHAEIDPLFLEDILRHIAKISGAKINAGERRLFYEYTTHFFNRKHRKSLFLVLVVLLEGFPLNQQVSIVGRTNEPDT